MEGIVNIFTFCGLVGVITICVILVVWGILRWLNPNQTRKERLDIVTWIAVAVLCLIALIHYSIKAAGTGNDSTAQVLFFAKTSLRLLILFIVVFFSVVLLLVIIFWILKGLGIIIRSGNNSNGALEKALKNGRGFVNIVRTPIVTTLLTCGILSLFILFPFLLGDSSSSNSVSDGNKNSSSSVDMWKQGVHEITELLSTENGTDGKVTEFCSEDLVTYVLISIILLGVGFAVIEILSSIIRRAIIKSQNINILDEYSSPIALLAVGVSILLALKNGVFEKGNENGIIVEILWSMVRVISIAAIIILALELISLLIDIRESLINKLGRYLFVYLMGRGAMFLLDMIITFFGVISNVSGNKADISLCDFEAEMRKKIMKTMECELEDQPQNTSGRLQTTFGIFDEKVTKK